MHEKSFPTVQRGSSLIEVLVAMLLMSFGVLAMTSLQAHAIQHSHATDLRARATLLAHDLADRMRANIAPDGDWSAYELSATSTSTAMGNDASPACNDHTPCAFNEMTVSDLAQWQKHLAQGLPSGRGHVATDGNQVDLWVMWDEADFAGSQAHESCPGGLSMPESTRCLHLRVAL